MEKVESNADQLKQLREGLRKKADKRRKEKAEKAKKAKKAKYKVKLKTA